MARRQLEALAPISMSAPQTTRRLLLAPSSAEGKVAQWQHLLPSSPPTLVRRRCRSTYAVNGKVRSVEIPGIMNMSVEPVPDTPSERGGLGGTGAPGCAGPTSIRHWQSGEHVRRSRHAMGQFGEEWPLCANRVGEFRSWPFSVGRISVLRGVLATARVTAKSPRQGG